MGRDISAVSSEPNTGLPIDIGSDDDESYDGAEHPNDVDEYEVDDVAAEDSDDDIETGQRQPLEAAAATAATAQSNGEQLARHLATLEESDDDERTSTSVSVKVDASP